jgi:hypothetical protein
MVAVSMGAALLASVASGPDACEVLASTPVDAARSDQLRATAWQAAAELPAESVQAVAQGMSSSCARSLLLLAAVQQRVHHAPELCARLAASIPELEERCGAWVACVTAWPERDDWSDAAIAAARSLGDLPRRSYWLARIAGALELARPALAASLNEEASRQARVVGRRLAS